MKRVSVKKDKSVFLGRDVLVREKDEEVFAFTADDAEKQKVFGGQEAIVSEEEWRSWGPDFFEPLEEISDETIAKAVRQATSVPSRRNRMQAEGRDRLAEAIAASEGVRR